MNIKLIDLLPKFSESVLKDQEMRNNIAYLLYFFAREAKRAIEYFGKQELHRFDPHVGETSCQIRAYIVLRLFYQKRKLIMSSSKKIIHMLTEAQKAAFFF